MTPAMQAARDRVVEACILERLLYAALENRHTDDTFASHYSAKADRVKAVKALLALEAKEQADAAG